MKVILDEEKYKKLEEMNSCFINLYLEFVIDGEEVLVVKGIARGKIVYIIQTKDTKDKKKNEELRNKFSFAAKANRFQGKKKEVIASYQRQFGKKKGEKLANEFLETQNFEYRSQITSSFKKIIKFLRSFDEVQWEMKPTIIDLVKNGR